MSLDLLNLSKSDKVRKILQKHTDGILFDEVILYSNTVSKINRKSKLQQRVLVITDKAIYNFTPGTPIGKLKRRILLQQIDTLSISSCLNVTDIVLHIPTEYDYLYRLDSMQNINQIIRISKEYSCKLNHQINVLVFELNNLSVISDNSKSKIKKNESPKQYMERKLIEWRKKYNVKNYQHHRGISRNNKIPLKNINSINSPMSNVSNTSIASNGIDNGLSPFNYNVNDSKDAPESFMFNVNIIHPQNKTSFEQKENEYELEEVCETDSESNNSSNWENVRNLWEIGDELEVYSHSKIKWYKGKIIKIYKDEFGEWFVIQYNNGQTEKDLQRFDKDLRPLKVFIEEELPNLNVTVGNENDNINNNNNNV